MKGDIFFRLVVATKKILRYTKKKKMTLFENLHTDLSVAYGLAIAHLALSLIYLFNIQVPQFLKGASNLLMGFPLIGKGGIGINLPIIKDTPILGTEGLLGYLSDPKYYLYVSVVSCVGIVVILNQAIQDEKVKND